MDGEILSAFIASLAISPVVAVVEKAIFSDISGKMTYKTSFKQCIFNFLESPFKFCKNPTFLWCWAVYGCTYVASNCSERYAVTHNYNINTFPFIVTSTVNVGINILKDRHMTRTFGVTKPRPLSIGTYASFAIRDVVTILGAFTLVEPFAFLLKTYGVWKWTTPFISQMICPVVSQLLSTPVFLFGMDLYNRPRVTRWERIVFISKNYWKTYYWARVCRVGPAYSVGGIINRTSRFLLTDDLIRRKKKEDEVARREKHDEELQRLKDLKEARNKEEEVNLIREEERERILDEERERLRREEEINRQKEEERRRKMEKERERLRQEEESNREKEEESRRIMEEKREKRSIQDETEELMKPLTGR